MYLRGKNSPRYKEKKESGEEIISVKNLQVKLEGLLLPYTALVVDL